jgi:hypothetical protein
MKDKIAREDIRETDTHVIYEFTMVRHTQTSGKSVITKKEIFAHLLGLGHKIVLGATGRYKNSFNQTLSYQVSFEKAKKKRATPKKAASVKKAYTSVKVVPKVP